MLPYNEEVKLKRKQESDSRTNWKHWVPCYSVATATQVTWPSPNYGSNPSHHPPPLPEDVGVYVQGSSGSPSGRLGLAVVFVRAGWTVLTMIFALLCIDDLEEVEEARLRVAWYLHPFTQCSWDPHRTHFPASLHSWRWFRETFGAVFVAAARTGSHSIALSLSLLYEGPNWLPSVWSIRTKPLYSVGRLSCPSIRCLVYLFKPPTKVVIFASSGQVPAPASNSTFSNCGIYAVTEVVPCRSSIRRCPAFFALFGSS